MSTIANEKLRRLMAKPRRAARRINPALIVGAVIALAAIYLAATSVTVQAGVGECRTKTVRT